MKNIKINEELAARLILGCYKNDVKHAKYLVDFLFKTLTEEQITKYLDVMLSEDKPQLPKIGDIILFKSTSWDPISCDTDILKDYKVYAGPDTFFGILTGDDSYGKDFNPWYHKFKLDIITNFDAKLIIIEKDIRSEDIIFDEFTAADHKRIKKIYGKLQDKPELPF